MAEQNYYQSVFSGAQIDEGIGRIVNGEIDQLAEDAKNSATNAANSEENAKQYAEDAKTAKEGAEQAKTDAENAAENAATGAVNAVEEKLSQYVSDAETAKEVAETAKDGAEAAQKAAEQARDEAQAIAGGDFMERTTYDPQNKKTDIFKYVDDKMKDVSVNTDAEPTQNSTNPVQSGGVFSALANKLPKENPVSSGVFTHDGNGANNTDVILKLRSNNGMLTGYGDVSSAFHFGGVPVYFDTLVFFGNGFSFPTPGGTLTGNFTQLKGFSNSEFRAGTTNYVETGCNYGAYPTAERQNFIVKNIDPAGGTGDNWSYQAYNLADDGVTWERVFGVKADGTIVSNGVELTPDEYFKRSGGYVDGSISPNSNMLNLGELGKAWYQMFSKIIYFFDASGQNSQYAFGMYQWGDNYTFVVRDAATNGFIADLWQINGATGVTNFNVKPTVAGVPLVTTADLEAAIGTALEASY